MASARLADLPALLDMPPPSFRPCPDGAGCTFYKDFKEYKFGEEGLRHLVMYDHPEVACRYGRECRAHARLCAGGWRFDDQCHVAMYSHGRPARGDWEGAHALAGCDGAWRNPQEAKTAGGRLMYKCDIRLEAETLEREGVELVRRELEAQGLGFEMEMLETVVPSKRLHPRLAEAHASRPGFHVRMPSNYSEDLRAETLQADYDWLKERPVWDVELLAGLLYTGTDAQGRIRRALREPSTEAAEKWRWTLAAVRHLTIKLAETPPPWLFHGLNNVRPPATGSCWKQEAYGGGNPFVSYTNLVSGSMSLKMARTFAKGEMGTAGPAPASHGLVLHMDMAKSTGVATADMRWISKFPDEQEWLVVPGIWQYTGLYLHDSKSEALSEGGELIHQECVWNV